MNQLARSDSEPHTENPSPAEPVVVPARRLPWGWILLMLVTGAAGAGIMFAVRVAPGPGSTPTDHKTRELQEREHQMELAAVEARQLEEIAKAKAKLQAYKDEIAAAVRLVADFENELKLWDEQVLPLQTNERGKSLAAGDYYIEAYRATLREPRPARTEANNLRRGLEVLAEPINNSLARGVTTYEPTSDLSAMLERARQTAVAHAKMYADSRRRIEALVQQAAREFPPAEYTLREAIEKLEAREADEHLRAVVAAEEKARKEGTAAVAAAKADAIRQDDENKLKQFQAVQDAKNARAAQEVGELQAQTEAGRVRAELEEQKIRDAAQKEKDRKLAQSDEVRQLLAPFITEGYWQPGERTSVTTDKKPVSLARLGAFGALQNSPEGLEKLLAAGTAHGRFGGKDKVRPRWPWNPLVKGLKPDQLEQLKQAQQYLRELGPTLVELQMLSD